MTYRQFRLRHDRLVAAAERGCNKSVTAYLNLIAKEPRLLRRLNYSRSRSKKVSY